MTKKELMNALKEMNVKFNKDSKKEELEKLYNENKKEEKEEMKEEVKEVKEEVKEEMKEEVKEEMKEEVKEEKKEEVKEEKKEEVKEEKKEEVKDKFNDCVKNISVTSETTLSRMKDNSVAVKRETTNTKTRKNVVIYRVYKSTQNKFRIDTTIEDMLKNLKYETRRKSASVYFVIKDLTAEQLKETTEQINENAKKYLLK